MKLRLLIGTAFLLVIPATIFFVRFENARLVRFAGKPIVVWALQLNGPANTQAAENVFRQVGPVAVKNLVDALERRNSPFSKPLLSVAEHLPEKLRFGMFRVISPEDAERLRLGAASALAIMGPKATSAIPVLGKALGDENQGVSLRAAMALGRIGPPGVPELLKALKDPNDSVKLMAIYGLSLAGSEAQAAVPALADALDSQNSDVRERAIQALSQIRHPSTVSALIPRLKHPRSSVRLMAARSLGNMGPWARESIPALIDASKDGVLDVRRSVLESLGKIRPAAETVVKTLANALSDSDPTVRTAAAEGLSRGGPAAAFAVPALMARLKDEDSRVRAAAVLALGAIGAQARSAIPALQEAAQNPDAEVNAKAQQALEQIKKGSAPREP